MNRKVSASKWDKIPGEGLLVPKDKMPENSKEVGLQALRRFTDER